MAKVFRKLVQTASPGPSPLLYLISKDQMHGHKPPETTLRGQDGEVAAQGSAP